ncbi:hypothetical protein ACQEUU_12035 [Nonomuraea sp. CA-218870]|uniref:hypothetical protein n=1 Tax=Nonomuraea sp. CA-218870 TaxID=3239998 RepID=UPI003D92EBB1
MNEDELLERRYRAVLRLLPESYRREREDEMAAAFLEAAGHAPDADNPRPRWDEVGSVLALAVRLRLGGPDASPRAFAQGAAVRLMALLGLAFLAAISVLTAVHQGGAMLAGVHQAGELLTGAPRSADRLLFLLDAVESGCWVVAFTTLARGHSRTAGRIAVLALVPIAGSTAVRLAVVPAPWPQTFMWLTLTTVLVIALLLGHHRDARPVTLPWHRTAAPLAAGGVAGAFLPDPALGTWPQLWTDPVGLGVSALAAGAVVCAVRRSSAPWRLALAMLAALLMAVRLMDLSDAYGPFLITGLTQVTLLAVLTVGLGVTGRRALPAAV